MNRDYSDSEQATYDLDEARENETMPCSSCSSVGEP